MVSPPYKAGYGVFQFNAAAVQGAGEGDRVVFSSLGSFAGAPDNGLFGAYIAWRGAGGWQTTPLQLPPSLSYFAALPELTPDLSTVLFPPGCSGANVGAAEFLCPEANLFVHPSDLPDTAPNAPQPGPNFELAGVPLKRIDGKPLRKASSEATSANLCRTLFRSAVGSIEREPLLANAIGTEADLYEMGTGASGCSGERTLRLVGVRNTVVSGEEPQLIDSKCTTSSGHETENALGADSTSAFNAVSADGSEVFFTVGSKNNPGCDGALFVRLNGERTVQISKPLGSSCELNECPNQQHARFAGANEAGTRVFFTTSQPLAAGDTDASKDLYMADIGCAASNPGCGVAEREVTSLVQVSRDANAGEAAEVQGVVDVAPDGGRVYFVARGVLDATANAQGEAAAKGADNLYVYDATKPSPSVRFVAWLCSGSQSSGLVLDTHCPNSPAASDTSLWVGTGSEAQTTGDGSFLVFATYARLSVDDTDTSRDVYRYDAQTGRLDRVSIGEDGESANGNLNGFDAQIPPTERFPRVREEYLLNSRAISEDGSRIVFETAERLSPAAQNGLVNAYEWHKEPGWAEGRVSLVSTGSDPEPVGLIPGEGQVGEVAITPSGRDIFFRTRESLVPQDTDSAVDVYDARLGEGFPEAPAPPAPCAGDACQGPLTNPAPLLVPGSVSQEAGGNFPAPAAPTVPAAKTSPRPASCRNGFVKRKGRCVRKRTAKRAHPKRRGG
jgi:hypothetical protein